MRSDPKFGSHNLIKPLFAAKHIKCNDIIMTLDVTELDLTEYNPFAIFSFQWRQGTVHIERITQISVFCPAPPRSGVEAIRGRLREDACRSSCGPGIDRPRDTAAGNNSSTVLAAPCSPCFKSLRIFRALTGSASSKYSSQSLFTSSLWASRAAIAASHPSFAASHASLAARIRSGVLDMDLSSLRNIETRCLG